MMRNRHVIVMLLGTFLSRFGYYMIWPYIAIILHSKFNISISNIGVVFFLSNITSNILSLYAGFISDKVGRIFVIRYGVLLSLAGYSTFFFPDIYLWIFGIALLSLGKYSVESCSKALIGDLIKNDEQKEKIHYFRYYISNIGTVIGPLVGASLTVTHTNIVITLTVLIYSLYFSLLFSINNYTLETKNSGSVLSSFRQLILDYNYKVFFICNFLIIFLYSFFDVTLSQYVNLTSPNKASMIIGYLYFTNAIVIILFQNLILKTFKSFDYKSKIIVGVMLMSFSMLTFMISKSSLILPMCLSATIYTIGEALAMPTINIAIDHLTPDGKKGLAYSSSNLANIGGAVSPLFGGFALQYLGNAGMFLSFFSIGLIIAILIKLGLNR